MDVWWVLQSSAVATLVAAVILGVKCLFHDKLDARWHYLICLVLLMRLLVPVSVSFFRTPVSLLEAIAAKYGLRSCRKICVQRNLSTPYVCGILHPALVLPEELAGRLGRVADSGRAEENQSEVSERPEEAVILHELLHQKYRDVLVNFLLHLVRALNWFNPLMWYAASVVQNDGEALCD